MRLIDADRLAKKLGITNIHDCEDCELFDREKDFCSRGGDFCDACTELEVAPTFKPERKTGQLIQTYTLGPVYCRGYECTNCKETVRVPMHYLPDYQYCPFCGAKIELINQE